MPILDVKTAVAKSQSSFTDLFPVEDVRLEEVELSPDEHVWRITLSGLVPRPKTAKGFLTEANQANLNTLADIGKFFDPPFDRVYKIFNVDAATGVVLSIKIRIVE